MARYAKFFSLGGGGGPNNLQLPVGTILDATLRQVQDGLGTGSPLYLSTGGLRIGTTAGSAMYWDNTNNRLGIGTNAPSATVDINSNTLSNPMFSVGPSFATGFQIFNTNNTVTPVYGIGLNASYINTRIGFYDTLTFRANGTQITEMTSSEVRVGGATGARVGIKGSGSTSATTSLLVQNSALATLLQVLDDGSCTFGRAGSTTYPATFVGNTGTEAIIGNGQFQSPASVYRVSSGALTFFARNNDSNGFIFTHSGAQLSTSTTISMINISGGYGTQLNAQFSSLLIKPTYDLNVNTTALSIARGIYYNPTITNLQLAQHRAIETVTGDVLLATTSGQVGIGTTTPVGILHLYKSAAATRLAIDGDAGQNRLISYRTGAVQRFGLYVNNTAESGSNAGSNFAIRAYNDAGALLSTPLFINRATGNVGVNTLTGTAKLQVVGSGSTGATSSVLVQNSAGTTALEVRDDLVVNSANSTLSFTNASLTHRIANQQFTGNTIACLGNLTIGGSSQTTFSNTTLAFQTSTTFNAIASPNNATRTGISIIGDFTNTGAGGTTIGNNFNITTALNTSIGNVTLNQLNITNAINTTGGTTLQRGFYYNPTLTGTVGFTHYAIQTTSGGAYINTATPNATACLQADSTTQGFLPPRMTTAEKNLIATPATGLMVFDTNLARPCFYNGATWTTL